MPGLFYVNAAATSLSMSLTFTTYDGDIVLRAGPEPDSKHYFRVHKLVLSLASPVFNDMFTFPQPLNQTSNGQQLPIVDLLDPPEVIDAILRHIYPGVEPPKIADIPTLTALLSAADKYNITSVYPVLKDALKTFLRHDSCFRAYIVACRFGFSEEAKEAARVGNTQSIMDQSIAEEVQHISSTDLLRWVKFVQERERAGRDLIGELLDWRHLDEGADCDHGEVGKDFYFRLEKAVENAFVENPFVDSKDLWAVLDKIPDPPLGCGPSPHFESGEYYFCRAVEEPFLSCPLRPMSIRSNLVGITGELGVINAMMLDEVFGIS